MLSVLPFIKSKIPSKYKVLFGELSPTGDILLINESLVNALNDDLDVNEDYIYSSDVSIYVRQRYYQSAYYEILNDLSGLFLELTDSINTFTDDKYIVDLVDLNILYLGKDDKDNLSFSMSFNIKFMLRSDV